MSLELSMHCDVCGCSANIEEITEPVHVQGFLDAWAGAHRHTAAELKMYHDAEVAVREYEIDTAQLEDSDDPS